MNRKLKSKIFERFDCQTDLAQFLNVSQSRVSRVIRGREELDETEKLRWAEALQCRPDEIFS